MNVTFRPIEEWPASVPGEPGFEPYRLRERARFDSDWERGTLALLRYELVRLGVDAVVIKLALTDRDIRRDGWPRANSRPEHPGVILEWQIGEQWYRRAAEKFDHWRDNVRAVALTLQRLRDIERWGAVSGEQYEGFKLELESPRNNALEARRVLEELAGLSPEDARTMESVRLYRLARRRTHPDAGGSNEAFNEVQEAWRVLGGRS